MTAKDRVWVALDTSNIDVALDLVERLHPYVGGFKIGIQFLTAMFAQLVTARSTPKILRLHRKLRRLFNLLDGRIFTDWKWHDIPNTVEEAAAALLLLQVAMFDVHASAGIRALQAAVRKKGKSLILANTHLTSISTAPGTGVHLAAIAKHAGCDGIVCAPHEAPHIRQHKNLKRLLIVSPGIRLKGDASDDHARSTTPTGAIQLGSDILVVGRSITKAVNPVSTARTIAFQVEEALQSRK